MATDEPQALAGVAGERVLEMNFDEPENAAAVIVAHAAKVPFDALVATDDATVLPGALAASALGLPQHPVDAVLATRSKSLLRSRLAAAGLPQPQWVTLGEHEDPDLAAGSLPYPLVVKPIHLAGSRGVIRVNEPGHLSRAMARVGSILGAAQPGPSDAILRLSRMQAAGNQVSGPRYLASMQHGLGAPRQGEGRPILVEVYVPGQEVAVEGICMGGRPQVLAIFDKPDPLDGPFFEETIYVTPSRLPVARQEELRSAFADVVAAVGFRDGPVHAEFRLPPDGQPVCIDVAARTIGGRCGQVLSFSNGRSLEELVISVLLGRHPLRSFRLEGGRGVLMLPIPRSGTLAAVHHGDEALRIPGITGIEITVPISRQVTALPEGDRYLGFVFAQAPSAQEAEAALRACAATLEVEIS